MGRNIAAIAITGGKAAVIVNRRACGRTGRAAGRRAARGRTGNAAAIRGVHQLHAQDDGVNHFYHGGGAVGSGEHLLIHLVQCELGAENLCAALSAKENGSLVEDGKAADLNGARCTYIGLGCNLVEITDIYAEETTVEARGLYVNLDIQQLGLAGANAECPVNDTLGTVGWVESKILNTISITGYSAL